jgi:hypothetical protein
MTIHQFNLQFHPEEDRLIFRLNTVNREEFRFFLTRRFVKILWPVLLQLLEKDYVAREPAKSHAVKELVEFEREKVLSQADFRQSYAGDIQKYPLGKENILLTQIKVKQQGGGNILCLFPSQGQGVEFPVNNVFLHTFCKLLADAVSKAGWDMVLRFAESGKMQPHSSAPGRVLH